jgi:hypothetical protein
MAQRTPAIIHILPRLPPLLHLLLLSEFASAAAPASAAPPNLQLCPTEEVTIIPHMLFD